MAKPAMSEGDISSADPQALIAYSAAGLSMDAQLEATAVRLAAILDEFAATCTEYRTGIDGRLADQFRDHARRTREHDLWVRRVADQFLQADAGGVQGASPGLHSGQATAAEQGDGLAALWQAVLAGLPPEVAAVALVLLDAGYVEGALIVAGVLVADRDAAGLDSTPGFIAGPLQLAGNAGVDPPANDAPFQPATDGMWRSLLGVGRFTPRPAGMQVVDGGPGVIIEPEPEPPWRGPEDSFPEQGGETIVDREPDAGPQDVIDPIFDPQTKPWIFVPPEDGPGVAVSDDGGQENRVRARIEEEGWQRPAWGESDETIAKHLGIPKDQPRADVVVADPAENRWLVAESKGSDIGKAFDQLRVTAEALWANQPGALQGNTELRVYVNAGAYARGQQTPDEGAGLAGWRIDNGYLGWVDVEGQVGPTGQFVYETVGGIRIRVLEAPPPAPSTEPLSSDPVQVIVGP